MNPLWFQKTKTLMPTVTSAWLSCMCQYWTKDQWPNRQSDLWQHTPTSVLTLIFYQQCKKKKKKRHDLLFFGMKMLSDTISSVVDVIREAEERGQVINEREWVSWANAIVILIFENTLRTIRIVPTISTPKSAWRSMIQRAAILWQARVRPGSGRGGQTRPDYLAITLSFPHFHLHCRLLMTLLAELPKQGNAVCYSFDHFTLTWCLHSE